MTGPQGHITQMVSTLQRRRDFAWKRLTEIPGLTATKPRGAFYLFPKIQLQGTHWKDDNAFVTELLEETGVLVVHGSGFDPVYGGDHFRSVFLPEESMMTEAFDAIEDFMKRHS